MFEGEKTIIFWIGLLMAGFFLFGLFTILWYMILFTSYNQSWQYLVPWGFGCAVFLFIGFYMMKYGVKKEKESGTQVSPKQV